MQRLQDLPPRARWFIAVVVLAGAAVTAAGPRLQPVPLEIGALLFVAMTACAGLVKVPLPVVGSLSLGYAFILATLMGFGLGASILAALLSALTSELVSWIRGRRPPLHRTAFNAGVATLTASLAGCTYLAVGGAVGTVDLPRNVLAVLPYTLVFMLLNLGLISMVIHLTGERGGGASLRANLGWSIPGYLAGSSLAILLNLLFASGKIVMLGLAAPFAYLVHLAYRARTDKVEEEKRHSQQTAELYFGIIRALALAVEAKDENTEEHLRRVEHYSVGLARLLGLDHDGIEAIRAGALLHDVGKLAIPEYILTKPGKLTAEEMEYMKVHPEVGADILAAVPFPFPLAPIVRHHHERWDGTGYPDGLAGDAIPLGARILSAVDCFDAISSDRPYRKAVPREEALRYMRDQSGAMFDPRIAELLVTHADRLEAGVSASPPTRTGPTISRGTLPGGAETVSEESERQPVPADELRLEAEVLAEVARVAALGLAPGDRLELVSAKLSALIPHRTLVLYRPDGGGERMVAKHTVGLAARKILGHSVALGERMTGWAALQRRPYAGRSHRNALERDGSRSDLEEFASDPRIDALDSAAVVPVGGNRDLEGVLALYADESCGVFDDDTLRRITLVSEIIARFLPRDRDSSTLSELDSRSRPA